MTQKDEGQEVQVNILTCMYSPTGLAHIPQLANNKTICRNGSG